VHSPHALLDGLELTPGLHNTGHVKLILKVRRGDLEGPGYPCHRVRLRQVSGQRFFADDALDFGPVLDGPSDVSHDLNVDGIWSKNAHDVNGGAKIGNGLEHLGVPQAVPACSFG
jgi:hypothetical protein